MISVTFSVKGVAVEGAGGGVMEENKDPAERIIIPVVLANIRTPRTSMRTVENQ